MKFPFSAIAVFAFLVPLCAMAQDKKIQVRFASQGLSSDMPQMQMLAGELKTQPFDVSSEFFTDPLEAPGRVFALRAVAGKKDIATVRLPEAGSRFIILLLMAGKEKGGTLVIPDDRKKFRGGDVYAYNASAKTVLGRLGTAKLSLSPGKAQMVRPAGIVDGQFYEVRFATQEKEGTRMFSSARWPAGEKERCYVFFYSDARNPHRTTYRVISEVLHAEEKER